MERFFTKYPYKVDEGHAIKMMLKNVKKAYKAYKNDKEYMTYLAKVHCMLEDFFNEKGINPKNIVG